MKNFESFGIMLDCSRNNVMNIKSLKKFIDIISQMGYNSLQLYTEDTYEVTGEPYFGYMRGRYTKNELKEISLYSKSKGVELIPCIQTLAHINALTRWGTYHPIIDCNDILLAGEDRTYELIENMFKSLSESFLSRKINIGMDEAHMVGLGKYLDKHGYHDRFDIMISHLAKVIQIAEKYGFKPMMWSDMFFRLAHKGEYYKKDGNIPESVIKKVPENVELIYWDYYSADKEHYDDMIRQHKSFNNGCWFAGGAWKWTGFVPNNAYSIKISKNAISSCLENNVKNMFITMWADNGGECSAFSVLPSLMFAAEYANGNEDLDSIKKKFRQITGTDWDAFMLLDSPNLVDKKDNIFDNPSKYMLYNDYFTGVFDSTVNENGKKFYKNCGKLLSEASLTSADEWKNLFINEAKLCEVLELKYDIGVRLRQAYKTKNIEALNKIVKDLKKLSVKIQSFYNVFKELWFKENKPHGFDVQDIRLGGLMQRTISCRIRIEQFIDKKIESIPEFEEELLDAAGNAEKLSKTSMCYNDWKSTSTINPI